MRKFLTSTTTFLILLLAVSVGSHANAGLLVVSETEQLSVAAGNLEVPMEDAPRDSSFTFGVPDDEIESSDTTVSGQSYGVFSATVFQLVQHAESFSLTDSRYNSRNRGPPDHVPQIKV